MREVLAAAIVLPYRDWLKAFVRDFASANRLPARESVRTFGSLFAKVVPLFQDVHTTSDLISPVS